MLGEPSATLHAILDIELPGRRPRREERQLFVGQEAGYGLRPGMTLPVYVDPDHPDDLLVGL